MRGVVAGNRFPFGPMAGAVRIRALEHAGKQPQGHVRGDGDQKLHGEQCNSGDRAANLTSSERLRRNLMFRQQLENPRGRMDRR